MPLNQFPYLMFTTASPGLQRLLLFIVIDHFFGLSRLGQFSSDFSICLVLSNFTAIGWSNIVLTIPSDDRIAFDNQFANVACSAFLSQIWCVAILVVFAQYNLLFSFSGSTLVLLAWSNYQLIRSYYIALKHYRFLSLIEIVILTAIIGLPSISTWIRHQPYYLFALPLLMLPGVIMLRLIFRAEKGHVKPVAKRFAKPYEFAVSNLASSGLFFLLIPFTTHFLNASYAGALSLLMGIISIVFLIPRACSFFFIPELAGFFHAGQNDAIRRTYRQFRSWIYSYLGLVVAILATAWFYLKDIVPHRLFLLPCISITFYLLLTALSISQLFLPDASILISLRASREILLINIFAFLVFLVISGFFIWTVDPAIKSYLIYLASFTCILTVRGILTNRQARIMMEAS
jgi:O-antigen/teichoic acid export membrane protein